MTDNLRSSNTQDLLIRVLELEASMWPLVIVMDDCHWLDSASLSLLLDASRAVKQLLVIAFTRPFGPEPPVIPKVMNKDQARERNYPEQPPTIPRRDA